MKRGTAPFSLDRNGYHVSWDAIPAWVCTQCGEPFFESREVDLIQRALTELDRESAATASHRYDVRPYLRDADAQLMQRLQHPFNVV